MEFVYSDGKIQARKKFSFGPSYQIEVESSVADGPQYLPVEVSWPGGFGDHSLPYAQQSALRQAVYHTTQDLVRVPERKVDEDRSIPGPLDYAGMEDRYFVNILFPGSQDQAFRFGRRALAPTDQKEKDAPKALTAMLGSPLSKPLTFRMFVAPKDIDVLRSASPPLEGLIDFGWFSFIAKPLFLAMRYVYDHWTHNYGWAIILLTIVINLAMFPLKLKSIQSAQKMQRIAPLVKSIQDRYKQYKFNDPRKQRMNQEVMKLYQEHGINPVGGCLPMALQIPFLYGFYNVLNQAIELRHAPWTLWIKDLSAPDRLPVFGYHIRSEEHTSELQSRLHLVCRLLLEKKNTPYCSPGKFAVIYGRSHKAVTSLQVDSNPRGVLYDPANMQGNWTISPPAVGSIRLRKLT